jgi:hypothetical protein
LIAGSRSHFVETIGARKIIKLFYVQEKIAAVVAGGTDPGRDIDT